MKFCRRLSLTFAAGILSLAAAYADQAADKAKLESLRAEIADTRKRIEVQTGRQSRLEKALRERELAIAGIGRRLQRLQTKAAALEQELAQLEKQRLALRAESEQQQQRIAQELTTAYRLGRAEPVKLLLNQEDPDRLARNLKYYEYFLKARSDRLEDYRQTLTRLAEVEENIHVREARLADSRTELENQRRTLEKEQEQRRQVLAAVKREVGSEKSRLTQLNRERESLEQVLATVERAVQNMSAPGEPFPKTKGGLPWPLTGRVLAAFGGERAANLPWTGWLLEAEEGEPVRSVHNGRVVFADYLRGYGLVLILDHGKGYLSLYAHNQVLLADLGEWVRAGQTVARAGRSGGLSKSALYFEIRHNGRPQDPKIWLAARR